MVDTTNKNWTTKGYPSDATGVIALDISGETAKENYQKTLYCKKNLQNI